LDPAVLFLLQHALDTVTEDKWVYMDKVIKLMI
jgi:hypothetical protein